MRVRRRKRRIIRGEKGRSVHVDGACVGDLLRSLRLLLLLQAGMAAAVLGMSCCVCVCVCVCVYVRGQRRRRGGPSSVVDVAAF